MADFVEQLKDLIKDNWTLTTEGLTAADIAFQDVDYNKLATPHTPHVCVSWGGYGTAGTSRRLQEAEETLYEFTFTVLCVYWDKFNKGESVSSIRKKNWAMLTHAKLIIDNNLPDGWESIRVDSALNVGSAFDVLPDLHVFALTVKAVIPWNADS